MLLQASQSPSWSRPATARFDTFFNDNVNYIKRFTNPEHLEIAEDVEAPELAMSSIITGAEIYLPLADLLNVEEEVARLDKELAKWQKELDIVARNLATKNSSLTPNQKSSKKNATNKTDYQAKYDATVERIEDMKKLAK